MPFICNDDYSIGKKVVNFAIVLIIWLTAVNIAAADTLPPDPFIDKDQYPFDGCVYRKWNVKRTTIIYEDKYLSSPQVAVLHTGDIVQALTGDIHSSPARIIVTKEYKGYKGRVYKEGDQLYVLTYMGEGWYRLWFKDEIIHEDLSGIKGFPNQSVSDWKAWGVLLDKIQTEWWVKVRTADGLVGWTNESGNFGNKSLYDSEPISIVVNRNLLKFDIEPFIQNDTVMAQLSTIAEAFGVKPLWDERIGAATVTLGGTTVKFIDNSKVALVNEKPINTGVRIHSRNGHIMVPVRLLSEIFKAEVGWDADTRQVKINK